MSKATSKTMAKAVSKAEPKAAPPEILPLFPLSGVLLLPGMLLPLHIFEPRYRNMVRDALAEGRHIGMIQPLVPRQDNRPPPGAVQDAPELYAVGCAGLIEFDQLAPDGRYLIHLRGICRFRSAGELALNERYRHEGYRRVRADYSEFAADGEELEGNHDASRLLEALEAHSAGRNLQLDWEEARQMPGPALVNSLAMSLPYAPPEKQALLEAPDIAARESMLIDLLKLGSMVDPLADPEPIKSN